MKECKMIFGKFPKGISFAFKLRAEAFGYDERGL